MLISAAQCGLVIIDLQERLIPVIQNAENIINSTNILIKSASKLNIPILFTEQYPKGLGKTEANLLANCENEANIISKLTFSAAINLDFCSILDEWRSKGRNQIILCGAETHVCVLQTAAGLIERDHTVFLVEDACGSRTQANRSAGINRIRSMGGNCVTTEMVVFEWLEIAGSDEFRKLSKLIK
tara:strand:+ start:144 stop:698 length:555 start_codon:yes stop_codon:yes gene_type:complete